MLPIAHSDGSLAAAWVDGGSSYGEPTPYEYSSRRGHHSGIPPEAHRILEDAFTANPYPSSREISLIATRTQLKPETIRIWFSGQSYRASEHSDPTDTTAPLHPPGPVSVQSDIQYTAGWLENKADTVLESDFHSHPPLESSTNQYLGPPNYTDQTSPLDVGTDTSINAFSKLEPAPPWFPGFRVTQPDNLVYPVYNLNTDDKSTHSLTKHISSFHNIDERFSHDAVTGSLRPGSVSSGAKDSSRSHRKHTSPFPQGGIITCDQCGAQFTGTYQRGNRARHFRQQHSEKVAQLSLECICRVCGQEFKRQDARRKHEWKKHSLPDTKPLPRRQMASLQGGSSHASACETGSDQGTVTCTNALPEEPVVDMHYRVPAESHRAHVVFAIVQKGLGKEVYDRYCQVFLAQCGHLAEDLRYQQSEFCNAFDLELRSISMQLLPEQQMVFTANEYHQVDTQGNASPECDDNGGHSIRGKAPASRRTSKASSRIHPYSGRPTKKSAPESLSIATRFEEDEAEMQREATSDILLSRASELYTQFSALEYTTAAHERINVEDVKARILSRLEQLHVDFRIRRNHANQPDHERVMNQVPCSPFTLHPASIPIMGGASDFSTPSHQPSPFIGKVQVPGSPSSQEYQMGDTSPGFSAVPPSSRTSIDFGSSTYVDQSQFTGAQFATDCSPSFHNHNPWLSPQEAYPDLLGSSHLSQYLLAEQNANAQMFPELDLLMASSPSEPHYALSHAPDDVFALSDIY